MIKNKITLIPRINKFKFGGKPILKAKWGAVAKVTNRYNPANNHYLDELSNLLKQKGFNDMQRAVIIANAIHENSGSPLPNRGRVGLWQGDKRQAKYLGNTVASNVEAFYKDYLHGKWYNTYDKNGWDPNYHKYFKNGKSIEDINYGMTAGYERFGGSKDRNNSEVKARAKTADTVYKCLVNNIALSTLFDSNIENYNGGTDIFNT